MNISLMRMTILMVFGIFGIYKFAVGYTDGINEDILIGGIFMCLGINLIFIHPLVLFGSIGGMIYGVFFTNPWYVGFFSILSILTLVIIITNIPAFTQELRNLSNRDN